MARHYIPLLVILLACISAVQSACVNGKYNGLPCASTTRYYDGYMGACGCGQSGTNNAFSWALNTYTGAGSQIFFNPSNNDVSWCGSGCGACYRLTPTGDCPTMPNGNCAIDRTPITVMITNLCPADANAEWCPRSGATNYHGYAAHIDLQDLNNNGQISAKGWDNPVVTYERVPCSSSAGNTATCSQASQCMCSSIMGPNCAAGGVPSTPKPATPRPPTVKPATPKPATAKPATAKPATPKPATPKPATPATPKPATSKPSTTPYITKLSCSPLVGSPGSTFAISFKVTAGSSALSKVNTGYHFFAVSDTADVNEITSGFKYSFDLAAGQSMTLNFNAVIPTNTPKGQYKITHGLWDATWAQTLFWLEPAWTITIQ